MCMSGVVLAAPAFESLMPCRVSPLLETACAHVCLLCGYHTSPEADSISADYEQIYHDTDETTSRKRDHRTFASDSNDLDTVAKDTTGSATNMRLARLWLKTCLDNHELCRTGTFLEYRLPRRLIDVSNARRPFLVNVSDLPRPHNNIVYVALSYCWGEGKRIMTLETNYEQHLQSLPVEGLPKTFADAFQVVRELGFQYIWTDAFCMIQDSWEDKKHQLPKMGEIYRYAAVTICAEGAPNARAGLFKHRDGRSLRSCKLKLSMSPDEHSTTSAVVTLATKCVRTDHLEPRGWILQEEILACRRLLFGTEMSWRCLYSTAAEVRPVPHPRKDISTGGAATPADKLRMWLYEAPRMVGRAQDRPEWSRSNHFDAWYCVIEFYSIKELTFVGDILNAVEGLANMFAQANQSTYLAGLYKEDMQLGLAWYVCNNERRSVAVAEGLFPSWSWASLGKVALRFRRWHARSQRLVGEGATILEATCRAASETCLRGEVEMKTKTMSGVLRAWTEEFLRLNHGETRDRRQLRRDGEKQIASYGERPRFPGKLCRDEESHDCIAQVAMDKPLEAWSADGAKSPSVKCALLCVKWSEDRGLFRSTGLVVREKEDIPGEYVRIGLAFFDDVEDLEAHPLTNSQPELLRVV